MGMLVKRTTGFTPTWLAAGIRDEVLDCSDSGLFFLERRRGSPFSSVTSIRRLLNENTGVRVMNDTMGSGHKVVACKHGTIVQQCRCPARDKPIEIVACPPSCPQRNTDCCDSHNQHCEPPSELCCRFCTEAAHDTFPIRHADGSACVTDRPASPTTPHSPPT